MEHYNVMRERLSKVVENRKTTDTERKKRNGKEKLRKDIQSKMKTLMIGTISRFEKFFGELWGHEMKEEQCSPEQLQEYETWQQCRDEILNNGNKLIRQMSSELDLYDVESKGYQAHFIKVNDE